MEQKVEQFNNFSGGISTNLRANYQTPKFARLWNFDISNDRAIQRYGWEQIDNKPSAVIVNYHANTVYTAVNNVSSTTAQQSLSTITIPVDGVGKQWSNQCTSALAPYDLGEEVDTGTVPKVYSSAVVYENKLGEIKYRRFFGQGTGQVLSSITTYPNTFLVEAADNYMYVFSGKSIHGFKMRAIDANGNYFGSQYIQSQISQFQPITQYMQEGDADGSAGTYLVNGSPIGGIITQVGRLQNLLAILIDGDTGNPYYSGAIDGYFGPALDTAVKAFQADYQATGEWVDATGTSLAVDGLVGPETSSTLSKPLEGFEVIKEEVDIIEMSYDITAVTAVGGSIAFATKEDDGHARVYIWDLTKDANGKGLIGVKTFIDLGFGVCSALNVLDGKIVGIMSPFTLDSCSAPYSELTFFTIHANFDYFPSSFVNKFATLRLRQSPDNNLGTPQNPDIEYGRYNYIIRKTEVQDGRLYFGGRLHLETNRDDLGDDEGAMTGIFSIDLSGNILFEATQPEELTDTSSMESFGFNNGGFVIATSEGTYKTNYSKDNVSGVITKIINGGQPWRNKEIENICLALDNTEDLDNVRIYVREAMDKQDNDAGWVKVYDGLTSIERRDFNNRVVIKQNVVEAKRINHFRELQVMVKIEGKGVELVDLTIYYNMLDLNK